MEHRLDAQTELRIETEESLSCTLVEGFAEIFGSELTKDRPYTFPPGSQLAIFTWQGCRLSLSGKPAFCYVSNSTPMSVYANTHAALEQLRRRAQADSGRGPRMMVVGPTDVGKSTLCKILINYAVRMGRAPVYVDLDVGQGQISIPGTIGALIVERPWTVEEGYPMEAPIVYHFGYKSPGENIILYNALVSKLAETVSFRCDNSNRSLISGVVINTCGWIKGDGYKSITHVAQAFEVDVILVVDQEWLFAQLQSDMPDSVRVVLLPKSGGVVERSQKLRSKSRQSKIKEYFYGPKSNLYPHPMELKFSEIRLVKIGAPALSESILPLGMSVEDQQLQCKQVKPNVSLNNCVLSMIPDDDGQERPFEKNIIGFILVTEVHDQKEKLTLLSPNSPPLPSHTFILSEIQYMDS